MIMEKKPIIELSLCSDMLKMTISHNRVWLETPEEAWPLPAEMTRSDVNILCKLLGCKASAEDIHLFVTQALSIKALQPTPTPVTAKEWNSLYEKEKPQQVLFCDQECKEKKDLKLLIKATLVGAILIYLVLSIFVLKFV